MTVQHVVLFQVQETASEEEVENAFADAAKHLSAVPTVQDFRTGPNIFPGATKRLQGVFMKFNNRDEIVEFTKTDNYKQAWVHLNPVLVEGGHTVFQTHI